jgi:hypothetical protein
MKEALFLVMVLGGHDTPIRIKAYPTMAKCLERAAELSSARVTLAELEKHGAQIRFACMLRPLDETP